MKIILILTSLMACCKASPQHLPFMLPQNGRIVGGEDAKIEEVPYQVAMLRSDDQVCGGSIIRPDVVLTAAHCIKAPGNVSEYSFRAGSVNCSDGGQLLPAESFVSHENYTNNNKTIDYDIAVFLLKKSFILGSTVAVINIPLQDQKLYDGTIGVASGWGHIDNNKTNPKVLQKVEVPVVNQEICVKKYADNVMVVTPRMFCAGLLETGGKDTCKGDSGGPFAVTGQLLGVTSWGNKCGFPGFPGVYARVASFTNWINKTIENMNLIRSSRKTHPEMSSEFTIV